ncbi:uncharacterized protein MELLADRAFT_106167 [Melampsora larici-populina 98AG31]|uniref:F-box domain-containing protein n=1 Tax=Melampsora larici-populina (strain 98AG31 / pathotype 3-4-7) TaxID=747676 RepID=F4RKL7_MELLP|nr:uncharacterized protein MELLADRAFT_106167 [Melampsora larici-populina 98AG31]EGG07114.1 hypothetical protein MELLADRAFT_106167 [Melampsora larici-populina 98AG31]
MEFEVYLGHDGPPVLNSFQNLAVVNRKFHRLCLPKLWQVGPFFARNPALIKIQRSKLIQVCQIYQHITFPSSVPAPMPLWTGDLLLKYANFVKSARFLLRNSDGHQDSHLFSEFERSLSDNTSSIDGHGFGYAIGVLNIVKIFKLCPSLEAVEVILPSDRKDFEWIPGPDLADQTWTANSWLEQFSVLGLECCEEITIDMANKFLNGRARFLSKLHIELHHLAKSPDMEIRFDLPALKTLRVLNDRRSSDLLASFENCKSIEVIEHWGHMYNDQWNFLKHLLSRRTWPKLLVLDIQYSNYDEKLADWPDVEELEETCKLFNITLLISKY